MKLEQQVCSLELAKRLKKLGVKQESLYYWIYNDGMDQWEITKFDPYWPQPLSATKITSAFTVAELGELFQTDKQIYTNYVADEGDWTCIYRDWEGHILMTNNANTEADARAKMLVYSLENRLVN